MYRPILLIADLKNVGESSFHGAIQNPHIPPGADPFSVAHGISALLSSYLQPLLTPLQNWDPPLLFCRKKPLSPKYLFLSKSHHIVLSPDSSLKIHLDKRQFITLVFVNPRPPAHLGLIKVSYLPIWYFFFRLGTCQKKLLLAVSILLWDSPGKR